MARHKNLNWDIPARYDGLSGLDVDHAMLAVLMDIRDELQRANSQRDDAKNHLSAMQRRLDCSDTLAIPRILKRISFNTAKPKNRKKPSGKKEK